MRRIRPTHPTPTELSAIRRSIPGLALAQFIRLNPSPALDYSSIRMCHLTCNSAAVTGLSALCSYQGTILIQEHTVKTDLTINRKLKGHPRQQPVWVYMPMDEDEYIEAISVCTKVRVRAIDQRRDADFVSFVVSFPLKFMNYG